MRGADSISFFSSYEETKKKSSFKGEKKKKDCDEVLEKAKERRKNGQCRLHNKANLKRIKMKKKKRWEKKERK